MNMYAAYIDYAIKSSADLDSELAGTDTIFLKDYQLLVSKVFLGLDSMSSLLLFHDTGVGKTVTTVYILKNLKRLYTNWTIVILAKKSLMDDPWRTTISRFAPEILNNCIFMNYDDQNFHNKFFTNIKTVSSRSRLFVVIDECHNFVSKSLTREDGNQRTTKRVYNFLTRVIAQHHNKMLCLSATPIVNSSREFTMLINLLRPGVLPPQSLFYNKRLIDEQELISKLGCICSYLVNNESSIFDNVEGTAVFAKKTVCLQYVKMSSKQEEIYNKARLAEYKSGTAVFRIYRRMATAFVLDDFPTKKNLTDEEYTSIVDGLIYDFNSVLDGRTFTNKALDILRTTTDTSKLPVRDAELYTFLYEHSCKYTYVCHSILASPGKCLVFEPFVNVSGISVFLLYLDIFGISHIEFSSRTKDTRNKLVQDFNTVDNTNGDRIKVCVFSLSGNEGISFLSINDVFILDMTWNEASLKQIIGRAIRLHSHANNSPDRRYVNVHFIVAQLASGNPSVDDDLLEIIQTKSREFTQLYRVLKLSSIEWIYSHHKDFVEVNDESGFKALISRPVDMMKSVDSNNKLARGENIWYALSPLMITIHLGFKSDDGRVYDSDGNFLTNFPEHPVVKIYDNKLIYIFSDLR